METTSVRAGMRTRVGASLRALVVRAAAMFRGRTAERNRELDRELDEEMSEHLRLAIEENQRQGMTAEEARAAALRAFGGVTQTREAYRTQRMLPFLPVLAQDVAFGWRQLRHAPGFAGVAVGSLALGIGASVAVFSVVRAVLLDPYPYKDADRMVHVELHDKSPGRELLRVTATQFDEVRRLPAVDDVFMMDNHSEALTGDSLPVSVDVGLYTTNLFTYMGVPPLLGRLFTDADAPGGNPEPVAVLSYLFWKKQYGGQADIVGKRIELDHTGYTVIGVAPPRFTWGDSEVYVPLPFKADPHYYMNVFVKLKPGATRAALAAQVQPMVDRYAQLDPTNFPQGRRVVVTTLNEEVMGDFQGALLVLFAAVLLLLLIGCANVSILLLARGTARQHEFSVRASIGASRGRILRQLLTESVMLSLLGAGLGVLAAYRGVELLAANLPQSSFPHEATAAIHVNGAVLLFAVGLALASGIAFGMSPAWQLSRPDVGALMQASGTRLAGTVRGRHMHRLLIGGQVALTMLLLASAGAALRAFMNLYHAPLGFNPDKMFFMGVSLPKGGTHTWQYLAATQEAIRQAAANTPGVTGASVSSTGMPPFREFRAKVLLSSRPNLTDAEAELALVSRDFFSTLQIPLLAGRTFTAAEEARAAHLAVVNRMFVRRYLPDGDAIGRSVRSPAMRIENRNLTATENPDGWLEIVGVVDDVRNDGLDRPVQPEVYVPDSFIVAPDAFLLLRASGSTSAAMRSVGQSLHRLNPELFVRTEHEMSWLLEMQAWGKERFLAALFAVFAGLALGLAATGIFSVVSYTVSQRTKEFGVRMALGAQRGSVVRLVVQSSLVTVAAGAAVGIALSVVLSAVLATSSHASMHDPLMLADTALLLLCVTGLACCYPAWRAASIDPMQALRTE